MKLFIKYMVSNRCKMVVKSELDKLGLHYMLVDLGEVEVKEELTPEQRSQLKTGLLQSGLELMDDQKAIVIEKIKNAVIELVFYTPEEADKTNFSEYLSKKLDSDYTHLANLYSEVTGTTIEHFHIINKIERVKELLIYDELNLTEISYMLNYSSVAHLCKQFKKITGLTPSHFKQLKDKRRNAHENV